MHTGCRCQIPDLKFKEDPERRETPYGRQLKWIIEDKKDNQDNPNNLVNQDKEKMPYMLVHLKDTANVRQKKRWSQVSKIIRQKFSN